jgi:hypothetical protein
MNRFIMRAVGAAVAVAVAGVVSSAWLHGDATTNAITVNPSTSAAATATTAATRMARPVYTATLDRKPVGGFATCNWWPGYFSPGNGTRVLDPAYARRWADDVAKLPPGGLAMLDFESVAFERDRDRGPVNVAPGELRDDFILAATRLCREAIAAQPGGRDRHIAIYGIWDYPVWFTDANAEVWLRRGPHLAREQVKRIESLKPLIDVTGCVTIEAYVGRARGDPEFPAGEVERDLALLAERTKLYRTVIGPDIPIYVFLWGRANAPPAHLKLSRDECQRIARRVRELDLIPVAWGDPVKDNDLLLRALRESE